MKLTIIIPYYNGGRYTEELLKQLEPQITKDVEVIVIDDGSKIPFKTDYSWIKVIRQKNAGASAARNTGLDHAKGEYIAFIDADDLISDKYVETILNKAKTDKFDYLYMSWKAFGGWNMDVHLTNIDQQFPPFNLCVWNRVYKRSMIGETRFNTLKPCAEDAQFIRDVKEEGWKKSFVSDYMYFYRSNAADSLTKRAKAGKVETRRIVYNLPAVTKDMAYLIDEFKELDKDTEVILMTNRNELPELENYAMVINPQRISGTELRGEKTDLFRKVEQPIRTQICIYVSQLYDIGGIETWCYNFVRHMSRYYNILILWDKGMDPEQRRRLLPFAMVIRNTKKPIVCDTLLNCRTSVPLPQNITYDKYLMIVHTCKMQPHWQLLGAEGYIFVSEAAKRSYNQEGMVIHNMTYPEKIDKKPLLLVSATRLSWEKGEDRIQRLAAMLHARGILFTWLVFSDHEPKQYTDGLVYRKPTLDIKAYIKQADWFIQLSTMEAFCYSIVEALELGTPVLSTPLDVLPEISFKEGENGFVIPFDVTECKDIEKLLYTDLKGFKYSYDNKKLIEQWREVLGDTEPAPRKKPQKGFKTVIAVRDYFDTPLNRSVKENEVLEVPEKYALAGVKQGFYEIIA